MPKTISIPGVGNIAFPDEMDDGQINSAIENEILPKQKTTTPAPPLSMGGSHDELADLGALPPIPAAPNITPVQPNKGYTDTPYIGHATSNIAPSNIDNLVKDLSMTNKKRVALHEMEKARDESDLGWSSIANAAVAGAAKAPGAFVETAGALGASIHHLLEATGIKGLENRVAYAKIFGASPETIAKLQYDVDLAKAGQKSLPQDVAENPVVKIGQVSKEDLGKATELTPQEQKSRINQAVQGTVESAPGMAMGGLAPAYFGLRAYTTHVTDEYKELLAEGKSEQEAADTATKHGYASGLLTAGTFQFLPPLLKSAAARTIAKPLIEAGAIEHTSSNFAKYLFGRAPAIPENFLLGAAAHIADQVGSGKPFNLDETLMAGLEFSAFGLIPHEMPIEQRRTLQNKYIDLIGDKPVGEAIKGESVTADGKARPVNTEQLETINLIHRIAKKLGLRVDRVIYDPDHLDPEGRLLTGEYHKGTEDKPGETTINAAFAMRKGADYIEAKLRHESGAHAMQDTTWGRAKMATFKALMGDKEKFDTARRGYSDHELASEYIAYLYEHDKSKFSRFVKKVATLGGTSTQKAAFRLIDEFKTRQAEHNALIQQIEQSTTLTERQKSAAQAQVHMGNLERAVDLMSEFAEPQGPRENAATRRAGVEEGLTLEQGNAPEPEPPTGEYPEGAPGAGELTKEQRRAELERLRTRGKTPEGNIRYSKEQTDKEFEDRIRSGGYTPDESKMQKEFGDLGTAQRGPAESLGTNGSKAKKHGAGYTMLQGSVANELEHVGDLIHRLSSHNGNHEDFPAFFGGGGEQYGREAALNKIKNALYSYRSYVQPYGLRRYIEGIAKSNHEYATGEGKKYERENAVPEKFSDALNQAHSLLDDYANEHAKLKPVTVLQKLANDATVALGRMDDRGYVDNLQKLESALKAKDWMKSYYTRVGEKTQYSKEADQPTEERKDTFFNIVRDNPMGFTVDPITGEKQTTGYVVAPTKLTEMKIAEGDFTPQHARDYLNKFRKVFEKYRGQAFFGGWKNGEGQFVLDVSFLFDNVQDALYVARNGQQDAIFHLDEFNEIKTEPGIKELSDAGNWNNEARPELGRFRQQLDSVIGESGGVQYSIEKARESEQDFSDLQWWKQPAAEREAGTAGRVEAGQAEELGPMPGQKGRYVPMTHWSNFDLRGKEIDPEKYGSGYAGEEKARKSLYPNEWVNRSYFGLEGYEKEGGLGKYKHTVEVPAKSLYDLEADPLDLQEKASRVSSKKYGRDERAEATVLEKLIRDAGYSGYYSRESKIAASFRAVQSTGRAPMYSKEKGILGEDLNPDDNAIRILSRPDSSKRTALDIIGDPNAKAVQEPEYDLEKLPKTKAGKPRIPKFSAVAKIGDFLSRRSFASGGRAIRGDKPEDVPELGRAIADEAEYAINGNSLAVGWYDNQMHEAWKWIENKHPDIVGNPGRKAFYTAILSITSNGQAVEANFRRADQLYTKWKKTGVIETDSGFGGKSADAINAGLKTLDLIVKKIGMHNIEPFLKAKFTVEELRRAGVKITGELGDFGAYGSSIFGPKVGGGFYQNLSGNFDPITMDLWWMRTINRMRGILTEPSISALDQQIRRLYSSITPGEKTDAIKADAKRLLQSLKDGTFDHNAEKDNPSPLMILAKGRLQDFEASGYKKRTEANRASKNLAENMFGMAEAPMSGAERAFIRKAALHAQKLLKERGIHLTNADLQAVMWYLEKDLYAKLGSGNARSEGISYQDAARKIGESGEVPEEHGRATDLGVEGEPAGEGAVGTEAGRNLSPKESLKVAGEIHRGVEAEKAAKKKAEKEAKLAAKAAAAAAKAAPKEIQYSLEKTEGQIGKDYREVTANIVHEDPPVPLPKLPPEAERAMEIQVRRPPLKARGMTLRWGTEDPGTARKLGMRDNDLSARARHALTEKDRTTLNNGKMRFANVLENTVKGADYVLNIDREQREGEPKSPLKDIAFVKGYKRKGVDNEHAVVFDGHGNFVTQYSWEKGKATERILRGKIIQTGQKFQPPAEAEAAAPAAPAEAPKAPPVEVAKTTGAKVDQAMMVGVDFPGSVNVKLRSGMQRLKPEDLHITIAGRKNLTDEQRADLEIAAKEIPPPENVEFGSPHHVKGPTGKESIIVPVIDQEAFRKYAEEVFSLAGIENPEPDRMFHLTVANKTGKPLDSVGDLSGASVIKYSKEGAASQHGQRVEEREGKFYAVGANGQTIGSADTRQEAQKLAARDWFKTNMPEVQYSKENPKEEEAVGGETYGVAARVRARREEAGVTEPTEPGQGVAAEAQVEHGRDLIKRGSDPESEMKAFEQDNRLSGDAMAVVRAHGEFLNKEAKNAEDKFGTESPEYKGAKGALSDWDARSKKMQTEWHKIGQAQQGETDVDTGSFTGISRAYEQATGQKLNPKQEKKAKKLAADVKKADAAAAAATEKLGPAIENIGAPVEPHVRLIAEKLKGYFDKRATDALARIKARRAEGRTFTGIDPSELPDYADYGASKILSKGIQGAEMAADWAAEMKAEIGEQIAPHLKQIWDASQKVLEEQLKKVAKITDRPKVKKVVKKIVEEQTTAGLKSEKSELTPVERAALQSANDRVRDIATQKAEAEAAEGVKRAGQKLDAAEVEADKARKAYDESKKRIRDAATENANAEAHEASIVAEQQRDLAEMEAAKVRKAMDSAHKRVREIASMKAEAEAKASVKKAEESRKIAEAKASNARRIAAESAKRLRDAASARAKAEAAEAVKRAKQKVELAEIEAKRTKAAADAVSKRIRDIASQRVAEANKRRIAEAQAKGAAWRESIDAKRLEFKNHKPGTPFTEDQLSVLWGHINDEYIKKGNTDMADIVHKAATDLGLHPSDVLRGINQNKAVKRIADDVWQKQKFARAMKQSAKRWLSEANDTWLEKVVPGYAKIMFSLKTAAHGTVALGTHAPLVIATNPVTFTKNFGKMYRLVLSPQYYEMQQHEMARRANYVAANRAGLVNDMSIMEDWSDPRLAAGSPKLAAYMKAKLDKVGVGGLVGMGTRGYSVLKIIRQDMFDNEWNKLASSEQTPEMAKAIADSINHITGVIGSKIHGAANLALFAPKLQFSRVMVMAGDPIRAFNSALKMSNMTPEQKWFAKNQLKEKAKIFAVFTSLLAANQALNTLLGDKKKLNGVPESLGGAGFDPMSSDFMKFRVAGMNFAWGSPFLTMARLPMRLFQIGMGSGGKMRHVVYPDESMYKTVGSYARTQLSPGLGPVVSLLTKGDYQERPLPQIPGYGKPNPVPTRLMKQGVKPYTWHEFAADTFLPIPLQEGAKEVFHHQALGDSAKEHSLLKAFTVIMSMAATGGRITEDWDKAEKPSPEENEKYNKLLSEADDESTLRATRSWDIINKYGTNSLDQVSREAWKFNDPKLVKKVQALWESKNSGATVDELRNATLPNEQRAKYVLERMDKTSPSDMGNLIISLQQKKILSDQVADLVAEEMKRRNEPKTKAK